VRRDLVSLIKRKVMPGIGLTVEQADLLIDLYGARRLQWPDPKAIEGGWVTFSALKESLVHARELLTRRLADLEKGGYVEIASVPREEAKALGIDSKSKKVRILPKGEERARVVYERYGRVCLDLINRLPSHVRGQTEIVLSFNEAIMEALRW